MITRDLYYQHSGRVELKGLLFILLAAPITTLILGFIYGYAIAYIPFIYLNFLLTIGFGFASGFVTGMAGYFGKIRNTGFMVGAGILTGLLAEYFGWVYWLYAFTDEELLVYAPFDLLYYIGQVAENGAWSIGSATPTGWFLVLIWVIEALIIIGAATLAAMGPTSDVPYCEECDAWTDDEAIGTEIQSLDDNHALVNSLEQGNYDLLKYLKPITDPMEKSLNVTIRNCPKCDNSWYIGIEEMTPKLNKKNEVEHDTNNVVKNLSIHGEVARDLKIWAQKMREGVFFGEEKEADDADNSSTTA